MSSPKAPAAPAKAPEAARTATPAAGGPRKRTTGRQSTIVTGSQGLTEGAVTQRKTLLGQ